MKSDGVVIGSPLAILLVIILMGLEMSHRRHLCLY